jgi:hypothetical protein
MELSCYAIYCLETSEIDDPFTDYQLPAPEHQKHFGERELTNEFPKLINCL